MKSLITAIDTLFDIEKSTQSEAEFHAARAAFRDQIMISENVIKTAAEATDEIENLRNIYSYLIGFGHEKRSLAWISCMRTALNRAFNCVHGWQL